MPLRSSRAWLAAAGLAVGLTAVAACQQAPATPATPASPAATTPPAAATAPAAAATAQPAGSPQAQARTPQGSVIWARGGSTLRTFDPGQVNSSEGGGFMYPVFDSLGWLDSNGELQPALATSWSVASDNLTWTFRLGDWTFQNGRAVAAEDVTGTWDRVRSDPRLIGNASFANVESYRIVDPKTVEVKTRSPLPVLPKILSLLAIMPMQEFEAMGGIDRFSQEPIGSGPFRAVRTDFNDRIEYEAMPASFRTVRGTPYYQKVTLQFILEEGAREAALRSGAVQVAALSDDVAFRVGQDGFNNYFTRGGATTHVNIDTFTAPFTDVRVRQALNYAVDKQTILQQLYRGNGEPDGQMSGTGVVGYNPEVRAYPYDVARARQLLQEAGHGGGIRTTMTTVPTIASINNQVGEVIQQYLRAVGVEAPITPKDNVTWVQAYNTGPETRPGLTMQVFNFDQTFEVDPAWRWFSSDFTVPGGRRWTDEAFDRQFQAAKQTIDLAQRNRGYQQAAVTLNQGAPVIFLWRRFAPITTAANVQFEVPGFADAMVTQLRPKQ